MFSVKSPVNRMGGKYFLRDWLVRHIPEHVCYVEPFAGASHFLFAKEFSQVEVLNDADNHLIGFFRVIQHSEKRQRLIDLLAFMPYSRSLWQEIRTRWKQRNVPSHPMEASAEWFYLNRTCFSGDQQSGGFAAPSATGRNPVTSFRNAVDGLDVVAERLRNVCIENLDFREVIRRYDSPQSLVYADPPYYGHEDYYRHGSFSRDDHHRLSDLLHNVQAKVMLSHYECDVYDSLYSAGGGIHTGHSKVVVRRKVRPSHKR